MGQFGSSFGAEGELARHEGKANTFPRARGRGSGPDFVSLVEARAMGHDQLFKSILRSLFREFLELFFPDYAARLDFASVEFSDKELFKGFPDGQRREPDVVAQVRTLEGDPEVVVVHVEVQAEPKGDFRRRMFEYYALLWLELEVPVFPIALHLTRGPREGVTTEEYAEEFFGREVMRFRYASIALARLVGREYVDKGPLAAALAALMRRRKKPAELQLLARMLRQVVTSGLDEGRQALLVDVIKAYFPVPERDKARYERLLSRKEYRVVQETELTWSERLREEGKGEALKRMLIAKFGPLSADVEARIDGATSAGKLDDYLERVLTASSLAEMGLG